MKKHEKTKKRNNFRTLHWKYFIARIINATAPTKRIRSDSLNPPRMLYLDISEFWYSGLTSLKAGSPNFMVHWSGIRMQKRLAFQAHPTAKTLSANNTIHLIFMLVTNRL